MLIAAAAFELLWPVHITATAITISMVVMVMMVLMVHITAAAMVVMIRGITNVRNWEYMTQQREDNHTFVHNNISDHHERFDNNRIVDMALFPAISTAII